jgi:hypothetical protein
MKTNPQRLAVTAATLAIIAAACGGGDSAEDVLERLAEEESGEDVDIDFDDGEINVRTEDGEFKVEVDDDGDITIEGDDGGDVFSGEGNADEGNFTFEAEGDDISIQASEELPAGWPAEVPEPGGVAIAAGSSTTSGDDTFYTVTGQVDDGPAWHEAYVGSLQSADFSETTSFTQDDQTFSILEGAEYSVQVNVSQFEGRWEVSVTVGPRQ